MNIQPVIWSEVSQKEKSKFCLLMHIRGVQKDGTDGPFTGQQGRSRQGECLNFDESHPTINALAVCLSTLIFMDDWVASSLDYCQ